MRSVREGGGQEHREQSAWEGGGGLQDFGFASGGSGGKRWVPVCQFEGMWAGNPVHNDVETGCDNRLGPRIDPLIAPPPPHRPPNSPPNGTPNRAGSQTLLGGGGPPISWFTPPPFQTIPPKKG